MYCIIITRAVLANSPRVALEDIYHLLHCAEAMLHDGTVYCSHCHQTVGLYTSCSQVYLLCYFCPRIAHTCLTHSYLIEHTGPQKCTNCNQLVSVRHIPTECTTYDQARHQYCSFTDIKNICNHTPSQNILNFIQKINLYDQL